MKVKFIILYFEIIINVIHDEDDKNINKHNNNFIIEYLNNNNNQNIKEDPRDETFDKDKE